jgi:hypothetical protein
MPVRAGLSPVRMAERVGENEHNIGPRLRGERTALHHQQQSQSQLSVGCIHLFLFYGAGLSVD